MTWEFIGKPDEELESMLQSADGFEAWQIINELWRREERIKRFHQEAVERSLSALHQQMTEHPHIIRLWEFHHDPYYDEEGKILSFSEPFEDVLTPITETQAIIPIPESIPIRAIGGVYYLMLAQYENRAFLCHVYLLDLGGVCSIQLQHIYCWMETKTKTGLGIVLADGAVTAFSFDDSLPIKNATFVSLDGLTSYRGIVAFPVIHTERTLDKGIYTVLYEVE